MKTKYKTNSRNVSLSTSPLSSCSSWSCRSRTARNLDIVSFSRKSFSRRPVSSRSCEDKTNGYNWSHSIYQFCQQMVFQCSVKATLQFWYFIAFKLGWYYVLIQILLWLKITFRHGHLGNTLMSLSLIWRLLGKRWLKTCPDNAVAPK